ncbi:NAD(P)/FAD-dependent oxidoreductase [Paraburkholderia sp. FT54]|uniref:NAD(P)-binding protein n=1 Tax=Paraburkholderia sp. FT54 TaxID=3074437 RepID=UPI002877E9E7|nr:NAD(P)/FAD-dependent oxidoreductase [Paraburkholderia sp. FT54]WNC92766.1 NAD(P)/FAD-dependent oxidoreductase [Paraburkholderia sp. FT54]
MDTQPIETDYLVIGAGATAMAFVDTLLGETGAHVVMIDRHHRPGGHWNNAYPFVGLHQPSAFYGVNSRELSTWTKDETGLNKGMYELASGAEVLSHFDQVMRQRFLPSGRVQWFPMSDHSARPDGTHRFKSLLNGDERQVIARKKLVNATHARTEVPSTHRPKYTVAPDVKCIPLNRLPDIQRAHACYTVVGAGKTGMDACLWLLQNGVAPSRIRWIMPRDAWLLDRANTQPGAENLERTIGGTIGQFEAITEATSIPDLFARLEQRGLLLRIDKTVEPRMYRCAIISQAELEQLRRIEDIVRLGHLQSVQSTRIMLDRGSLPADPDTLYIDCSAGAIQMPPALPVFDGDQINLLMVRWCQPVFSAALIAYVESHVIDPVEKNTLCRLVPSPEHPVDWLRMWAVTLANMASWRQNAGLNAWLSQCRLNSQNAIMRGMRPDDTAKLALLLESGAKAAAAAARLPTLLATLN